MVPWTQIEAAAAPSGQRLRLMRRGDEFSIRLDDGNELMNSRLGGSEEVLARAALELLPTRSAPRVLVGGLGMGFTLRAVLSVLPPDGQVVVSEIVPELIAWAASHMAPIFGDCLTDPRVELRRGDVAVEIGSGSGAWDVILLDVDNGPDALTRAQNDALYTEAGVLSARHALRTGGVFGVWSAAPDPAFARRLTGCGFDVRQRTARAGLGGRGSRHTIWIAIRAGADRDRGIAARPRR